MVYISIGCAIWSYPGWVGEVYPPKTPARDFLGVYSHHFPAVEGNTTFYAIPDKVIIDRWIAQTPPGFKFYLKFPRSANQIWLEGWANQIQTWLQQDIQVSMFFHCPI